MRRPYMTLLLLAITTGRANAADISVRATLNRSTVQVGQTADLTVQINGAQNAPAPALTAPDGVSIRYAGPSTQVSIINNQMSASVGHHFTVTTTKPGTFTIGPISVEVDGKSYDAGSVTLTAGAAPPPARGQAAARGGSQQLRIELSAPKTEVYLRERLPLSVKLIVGNVRVSDLQYPTITGDGFELEKFAEPAQHQEQTAQGATQVVDLQTTLTPLRSGSLTIGPAKMTMNVITPRRGGGTDPFFEQFFGNDPFGARKAVELQSEPLTLTVLPLPDAGKPADFSGAVGRFEFEVKAAPLDLQVGDPITVTMTIRSSGNLENVTVPAIAGSDKLRVYPIQAQSPPTQAQPAARAHEKVFEQVVLPQQAGAVTLPELRFSYFDPEARAYRTITQAPIAVNVRASAQAQSAPRIIGALPREATRAPESLGRDIVFIKDAPGEFTPIGARRYRNVAFWLFQPLPLLAWIAALVYDRQHRRLTGDERYARFTRAGRQARAAIAGARDAMQAGNPAAFYDAVARAVSEYLSAKLALPPGSVTADSAGDRLRALGLPAQITDELTEFFATCERVRFAPAAAGDGDMRRTLERADAIVRALERERAVAKSVAKSVVTVALVLLLAGFAWATGFASATTNVESPNTLFFRANALYGEEKYADAAAEYEKILAGGVDSGNLYFNLGNAYFRSGDAGHAILNYERARRVMPRDPDLHANLGFAREGSDDSNDLPVYARLLFPLAERMSGDELLLFASALYTLLMICLIFSRLVPTAQRIGSRATVGVAVALAIVVTSTAYRLWAIDLPTYAVVVAPSEQTVRFEPSASGTTHYAAKPGALLRVLAEREGWAQVARSDGERGWIESAAVAKL
ncbi:MAG: BatD family protein [Deltaproteobacteria bacterium]|nr:BatD family protein [Deltaproteobacteria bacterium]MBI3390601.1 BatD family protein [Deltaproteobacteria bacterium]